ncbi:MAG: MBL fold metallo-hydrolase [Vicinamibacterales bacterium]
MTRPWFAGLTLALALSACARPTPEQAVVNAAAEALGGRERVEGLRTLVLQGGGTAWNLGQDMTMDATGQQFELEPYTASIDVAGGRMRVEETRTPNFLYYQGPQAQSRVSGLDGDIAYTMAAGGTASRQSARTAAERLAEFYHHPPVLVHAALQPGATLANARTVDDRRLVDITPTGTDQVFTLAIDQETGLPLSIESTGTNPNLGDVVIRATFDGWANASGVYVPLNVTVTTGGYKTAEYHYTDIDVNEDAGDLAAPPAAADAAVPAAPAVSVTAEKVGTGVWLVAGQSHNSAVVEFADHLLLIEAPQSEARTEAVMAKARELVPGKPLTTLLSTHHHFDHTGGLRAAVAAGLTVITQRANEAYYKDAVGRPHTIEPDALQRAPKALTIETVDDSRVLEDATQRMEIYHLSGNPHGDAILMAYFPKDRLIVEADAFSSNFDYNPYAANLLQHIRDRGLRVDRIVPLHGEPVSFEQFAKEVDAQK